MDPGPLRDEPQQFFGQVARDAAEPSAPLQPDCSLLGGCPQDGVDPARCVDDPDLFVVEMHGEAVASIEVAPEATSGLADGEWFGVFPDPAGACALAVISFRIDGGAL